VTRGLPVLVLVVLTLLSAGGAFGLNTVIDRFAAPPGTVEDAPAMASSRIASAPVRRPRALTAEQYLDKIMGRNLFDVQLIAAWAARRPGASDSEARTELKVRLLGTMVTQPETQSSAMIRDEEDHFARGYSVGDKLHDREIIKIEKSRVTLRRSDGQIEVLTVDDTVRVAETSSAPTPSTGSDEDGITQAGDDKYVVSRDLYDQYINDVGSISKMGRALLHRGPDGDFDGYRLSAIRRNTLADQLGIKNGDVIHAVNGEALTSVQSAMNAYNTMKTQSNFCFEITRRGSPQELCYDIQ